MGHEGQVIKERGTVVGKVVEITIDLGEGSSLGNLDKIVGRVIGKIRDQNGVVYDVLESLLKMEPRYFLVAPKAVGDSLEWAFKTQDDHLPVAVCRVLDESIVDSDTFDFSRSEYSAIGYLRFLPQETQ